jgi:hypothetical protein
MRPTITSMALSSITWCGRDRPSCCFAVGASEVVSVAGLSHGTYGTDGFPASLLEVEERNQLEEVVGADVEALVYLYASCNRGFVFPKLVMVRRSNFGTELLTGGSEPPTFGYRPTGPFRCSSGRVLSVRWDSAEGLNLCSAQPRVEVFLSPQNKSLAVESWQSQGDAEVGPCGKIKRDYVISTDTEESPVRIEPQSTRPRET